MIRPSWDEMQLFVVGAAGCLDSEISLPALVALPRNNPTAFFLPCSYRLLPIQGENYPDGHEFPPCNPSILIARPDL